VLLADCNRKSLAPDFLLDVTPDDLDVRLGPVDGTLDFVSRIMLDVPWRDHFLCSARAAVGCKDQTSQGRTTLLHNVRASCRLLGIGSYSSGVTDWVLPLPPRW
jgi:hypothetical protein